ncbi:lactococcin 972 family bacteriocin [Desulfosporosinus lacus]|uniref:Bacteriocin (Lactococcin_972) n=1 Tax=Desulfosporosinus lacus DSM 15449 TaxID=1121420 RepID=A0A1M5ZS56_9FIRM|nr:lactococcin 972 family bacteriocin [Desulfosporosinus lacus]SHI27054.1 Bacteriocin (Lactococcin_972) [Desulfosporosinus lacus DSM 15449]
MKKFGKILTISLCLIALFSTIAMGVTTPSGGNWNYGQEWDDMYEMAYSYYYHGSLDHGSYAAVDGESADGWDFKAAGLTSVSNSETLYYPYHVIVQCTDDEISPSVYEHDWYNTK